MLISALQDADQSVAENAADELGGLRAADAVPSLIQT
jgi:HEAT repeat protein